jgi:glycine betaine/choline ABC-type transport system substrate-binding protein
MKLRILAADHATPGPRARVGYRVGMGDSCVAIQRLEQRFVDIAAEFCGTAAT